MKKNKANTFKSPDILLVIPEDNHNFLVLDFLKHAIKDGVSIAVYISKYSTDIGRVQLECRSLGVSTFFAKDERPWRQYVNFSRLIKSLKPHKILIHSYELAMLCVIARITRPSNSAIFIRHHNKSHHLLGRVKPKIVDLICIFTSKRIVAVSETTATTINNELGPLRFLFREKIVVIQNGIDASRLQTIKRIQETQALTPIRILAIGRVDWIKNYEMMLKGLSLVSSEGIRFHLDILGAGHKDEVKSLVELISTLKLKNEVELKGWVPDISQFLNKSQLLVHTSRDEACPLVLMETLISGLPMIVNPKGGSKEIVERFGLLSASNEEELCHQILFVKENYARVLEHAESIKDYARDFYDSSKSYKRYLEIG